MAEYQLFGEWLMRTRLLQRMSYGVDPGAMHPDDRAHYFSEMGFAAVVELGELAAEIGWKSWGTDRTLNKENYTKELVDVLHFVANLAVAGGITDAELNEAYVKKMQVNRERMERDNYDGRVEGKCAACRRSFDDVEQHEGTNLCSACVATALMAE